MAALVGVGVVIARPWEGDDPLPTFRPPTPPEQERSVSIDFGVVTDPETDWDAVAARLEEVNANAVNLNAGRVEFTAFDWPEHPDAAAEPGTDHLAVAARHLATGADGDARAVSLIVDAFIPAWIAADPSVGGVSPDGTPSGYRPSATQLVHGEVGDRLVAYVAALGERYDPASVEVTELFLDGFTFGDDDLETYREMTGATDWPRRDDGSVDTRAPEIDAWHADVIADVLARMREALDAVPGGSDIALTMDVRVSWDDPGPGAVASGHDYARLLEVADRLQPWIYLGLDDRRPSDIPVLTQALADAGYDMSRFTLSVGLWTSEADVPIAPDVLAAAVQESATHGVSAVNVTPYTMLTPEHWAALADAWEDDGS